MGKDEPDFVVQPTIKGDDDDEEEEELEPGTQKMSFKPPQLDEEEERSPLIPELMRCDGCMAVAFQLDKAFKKAQSKFKAKDHRLKESEILEITDRACHHSTYQGYGISSDDSGNRIKGPGVFDQPGVAQMGGRTPNRLAEVCGNLMDADEVRIYQRWVTNGRSSFALREFLCLEETTLCSSLEAMEASYNDQNDGTRDEL